VPGHGPVDDGQALADYVAMLTTICDRMNAVSGVTETVRRASKKIGVAPRAARAPGVARQGQILDDLE